MVFILLLTLNLYATNFHSQFKCLQKIICSNYYINPQGRAVPTNKLRLDNDLLLKCDSLSSNFDVDVYKNNLTVTFADKPSMILNCKEENLNEEDCDLKNSSFETLETVNSKLGLPFFQENVNGIVTHKCSNPDEIFLNAAALKKSMRRSLVSESLGYPGFLSGEEDEFQCLSCKDYLKIIKVDLEEDGYYVRNGSESNSCINMSNGCFPSEQRVKLSKIKKTNSKNSATPDSFGWSSNIRLNNVGAIKTYSNNTKCVPKCAEGMEVNSMGICEFKSCEIAYESTLKYLNKAKNKALPEQLGDCDSRMIQSLWDDYKQKYKKIAKDNKNYCLKYEGNKNHPPMFFNSLNFASVILPVCNVKKQTVINGLSDQTIDSINFYPEGLQPFNQSYMLTEYYGENFLGIYSNEIKSKNINLENSNNNNTLKTQKPSGELIKLKDEPNQRLGW